MDERPDTVTPKPANRYNITDHGAITMYLYHYPITCGQVARDLGWQPDGDSLADWFNNFIYQCYLADQPGGKKSGAKDARIFLNTVFNTVDSLPKMVDKIQAAVNDRHGTMYEDPYAPYASSYIHPED